MESFVEDIVKKSSVDIGKSVEDTSDVINVNVASVVEITVGVSDFKDIVDVSVDIMSTVDEMA